MLLGPPTAFSIACSSEMTSLRERGEGERGREGGRQAGREGEREGEREGGEGGRRKGERDEKER